MLAVEDLVGLHDTVQIQLFQHYCLGVDLDYCDSEWFALVTEIILLFLRLHPSTAFQTFVDYEGYSISSKGFLPTEVDIMVISVKFTHSSPF